MTCGERHSTPTCPLSSQLSPKWTWLLQTQMQARGRFIYHIAVNFLGTWFLLFLRTKGHPYKLFNGNIIFWKVPRWNWSNLELYSMKHLTGTVAQNLSPSTFKRYMVGDWFGQEMLSALSRHIATVLTTVPHVRSLSYTPHLVFIQDAVFICLCMA